MLVKIDNHTLLNYDKEHVEQYPTYYGIKEIVRHPNGSIHQVGFLKYKKDIKLEDLEEGTF